MGRAHLGKALDVVNRVFGACFFFFVVFWPCVCKLKCWGPDLSYQQHGERAPELKCKKLGQRHGVCSVAAAGSLCTT